MRWSAPLGTLWLLAFSCWFYSFTLPNNPDVTRGDIITALPDLLSANVVLETTTDHGWHVLLERVSLGLNALGIVLAALALGRLLLRCLGICGELDFSTRLALSGGLGLAGLSLAVLGLGLAGCLSRPVLLGILTAGVLAELVCTWNDRGKPSVSCLLPKCVPTPRWLSWGALVLLSPFVGMIVLGALLPSTDFDVKEYHFEGPKEYFLAGRISLLPHNVYTSFPFLTEMLTLCGMVIQGDWYWGAITGSGVLMSFAIFTAVGLYAFVKRLAGSTSGWIAAALYLTIPWVYRISIIAYTEGALCCYVMLTLLAFDTACRAGMNQAFRWWLMVGLLAGSAAATKYPGLVFVAVPFGVGLLGWLWAQRTSQVASRSLICLAGYVLGIALAFGPWLAKNIIETGNPVYPLAWSLFGGIDWDAELNAKFKAGHAAPTHLLQNPGLLIADLLEKVIDVTTKSDWQSSLIFGLIPCAWYATERRRVRWVAIYAICFFLLWFSITHRIDRFWVPMLPLLCILAAVGAQGLWARWQLELRQEGWPMPLVLTGISLMVAIAGLTTLYHLAFISSGICGPNQFLIRYTQVQQQAIAFTPLIAHLEELQSGQFQAANAPPKVLLIGEAQVFDLSGEYVYNTVFDRAIFEDWTADPEDHTAHRTRRTLPPEEVLNKLQQQGITHLAVNWMEILRYRTTYGFTDYVTPERIQKLVEGGVLQPVATPANAWREVQHLPESWQSELQQWGQSLRTRRHGQLLIPAYEVFEVKQELAKTPE